MNLSPIVPLVVPIASLIIVHIFNMIDLRRGEGRASEGIYCCSTGLRIFLWCGTILLIMSPFLFLLAKASLGIADWVVASLLDIFMVVCCIYADRYSVILHDDYLLLKGFGIRKINYGDIKLIKFEMSSRGNSYLVLILFSGDRVRVSGYLKNFGELAAWLNRRIDQVDQKDDF